MKPAFSSPRQAGAFAALLLVVLLLPALVGKSWLPSREQLYFSGPWEFCGFPLLHHEIFEEKGDIDIVFMGASQMGCAIDAPYIADQLSKKLGRKAVVLSLCWSWSGYDALYFIAQDLLQHRKVHMIVFNDLSPGAADAAHVQTIHWFRFADNAEALSGLPLRAKASFYSSAILGLPRNLLGLMLPNLPVIPTERKPWNLVSPEYHPKTNTLPSDFRIYSAVTKGSFQFTHPPIARTQLAFVRKIGQLAEGHQTHLVLLDVPEPPDIGASLIEERTFWPDAFQTNMAMAGIPHTTLFSGLTKDETRKLFLDTKHLNSNGETYFTQIITPGIIQLYEDQTQP